MVLETHGLLQSGGRLQVKSAVWLRSGMYSTTSVFPNYDIGHAINLIGMYSPPRTHSSIFRHRPSPQQAPLVPIAHSDIMGGDDCCITFHTYEFLLFLPVGGSTIVTVARFLLVCLRAPERRASHSELVASPCPPLSEQGAGGSSLWLMFVTLFANHATQHHVSNL